jgi:DNA-binding XRE family transcriptional regulator
LEKYIEVTLPSNVFDITYAHSTKNENTIRSERLLWREIVCGNIAHYCKLDGRTDTELGDRIGISRKTLNNYRLGKSEPLVTTLLSIASVLGVDITRFFMAEDDWAEFIKRKGF